VFIVTTANPEARTMYHNHHLTGALPALRPRLWTFALRLAGNRHDALDLVRRACAHAFDHPEEFPTGFATPSAMFSLVHLIWFRQRAAAVYAATPSNAGSDHAPAAIAPAIVRGAAAERAA
jgi:RNA polymerase sigma-70 factor, ECF subfamily